MLATVQSAFYLLKQVDTMLLTAVCFSPPEVIEINALLCGFILGGANQKRSQDLELSLYQIIHYS